MFSSAAGLRFGDLRGHGKNPQPYAEVISQHRDGESSFYQFDGIYNVRQLTDDAQAITDEYDFDAWGDLRSSTGSTANSQLYKGKYLAYHRDPNSGPETEYALHYRHYNPKTGRLKSEDPAEDDLNLYRYVRNN
ncbi:MAG: RHS repeat-associated core domain-containing protein [Planctomycetaceae bacterium]